MRITLPDNNWADVRESDDLYEEDRKQVLKHVQFEIDPTNQRRYMRGDFQEAAVDALIARIVENWSYTHLAVPGKDPESMGKLKIKHAKALREGVEGHLKVIYGTDEENPTGSASSNSSSLDELAISP